LLAVIWSKRFPSSENEKVEGLVEVADDDLALEIASDYSSEEMKIVLEMYLKHRERYEKKYNKKISDEELSGMARSAYIRSLRGSASSKEWRNLEQILKVIQLDKKSDLESLVKAQKILANIDDDSEESVYDFKQLYTEQIAEKIKQKTTNVEMK
ncbi:MAG: hypothetical protein ACPGUY_02655, partial [Akkermansiaceae bacterium]